MMIVIIAMTSMTGFKPNTVLRVAFIDTALLLVMVQIA